MRAVFIYFFNIFHENERSISVPRAGFSYILLFYAVRINLVPGTSCVHFVRSFTVNLYLTFRNKHTKTTFLKTQRSSSFSHILYLKQNIFVFTTTLKLSQNGTYQTNRT